MLIPLNVFPIHCIAGELTRYGAASAIKVERVDNDTCRAIACNKHQAIIVTWPTVPNEGDYPTDIGSTDHVAGFVGLVQVAAWKEIGERAAKIRGKPVLRNVLVDETVKTPFVALSCGDPETSRVVKPRQPDGHYPNVLRVVPKYTLRTFPTGSNEAVQVMFDAKLLSEVLLTVAKVAADATGVPVVNVFFPLHVSSPVVVQGYAPNGVVVTGLCVPLSQEQPK